MGGKAGGEKDKTCHTKGGPKKTEASSDVAASDGDLIRGGTLSLSPTTLHYFDPVNS